MALLMQYMVKPMHQTMKVYQKRREELNHQTSVNPNETASGIQCTGYVGPEPLVNFFLHITTILP
jgi:hypothetical protein